MREALDRQPVIEQAKGMVMFLCGVRADKAFALLREVSQHTNVKIFRVATIVVAAASRQRPPCEQDPMTVQGVLRQVCRRVPGFPADLHQHADIDQASDGQGA